MYDNLVELLDSVQNEIHKKFENSKSQNKIKEILDKQSECIRQFFISCLKHTDSGNIDLN